MNSVAFIEVSVVSTVGSEVPSVVIIVSEVSLIYISIGVFASVAHPDKVIPEKISERTAKDTKAFLRFVLQLESVLNSDILLHP